MEVAEEREEVDTDAYLEGFELGLLAVRGRLAKLDEPTKTEILLAVEELRSRTQALRKTSRGR